MIFLTVGTQLPFDRLVRAVDGWAAGGDAEIFGQIAEPGADGYRPEHFDWVSHLDPKDFADRFAAARAIIAHAGMGTILSALTASKPVVILPRRAALGEQRNDHQLATARRFADRPGVLVCMEEDALPAALDRVTAWQIETNPIGSQASPELLAALHAFIHEA